MKTYRTAMEELLLEYANIETALLLMADSYDELGPNAFTRQFCMDRLEYMLIDRERIIRENADNEVKSLS